MLINKNIFIDYIDFSFLSNIFDEMVEFYDVFGFSYNIINDCNRYIKANPFFIVFTPVLLLKESIISFLINFSKLHKM
jgi:hypothetical protein